MRAATGKKKTDTGVGDILPSKGAPQVVEIVVTKANNGIEKGETKKVLLNSATTQYMLTNGYWKIK